MSAAAVRPLGTDPATGAPVTVRRGPYGAYVQLGGAEAPADPSHNPSPDPGSQEAALLAPAPDAPANKPGCGAGGGEGDPLRGFTDGAPTAEVSAADAAARAGRGTPEGAEAAGIEGAGVKGRKGKKKKKAAGPGVRRATLRPGLDAAEVTLEDALSLLQFPKARPA